MQAQVVIQSSLRIVSWEKNKTSLAEAILSSNVHHPGRVGRFMVHAVSASTELFIGREFSFPQSARSSSLPGGYTVDHSALQVRLANSIRKEMASTM